MFVHLNIFYLKDVREQCDKLKETVSSKDKKLARMNKAFGNKVNITQLVFLILIYWIEIYAVHNAVHFLNNWDTEKVYDVLVDFLLFLSLLYVSRQFSIWQDDEAKKLTAENTALKENVQKWVTYLEGRALIRRVWGGGKGA